MCKYSFLFACLICLNCNSGNNSIGTNLSVPGDSTVVYLKILSGLKLEYVVDYRQLQRFGTDLKAFGLPETDSIFKIDSAVYFDSYQKFFAQDHNFVEWLLKFKNDTTESGLWREYLSPHSSFIGECHLPMMNSRAAINLLENFLNGNGFECYECKPNDLKCSLDKYAEIERLVELHKGDIALIRSEWKKRNVR